MTTKPSEIEARVKKIVTEQLGVKEEEIIAESLETNVDWTETGIIELTGIVGGEVYTFVTAADEESHTITVDSVDEALKQALVAQDKERLSVLRMLKSALKRLMKI